MKNVIRRREPRTQPEEGATVRPPDPHPSGARPPILQPELIPRHVALV
ncbi:MAG: isoprenyl transferase, partial [Rhodococcus sp. (in: high G+C Gram-positive bacteria)]